MVAQAQFAEYFREIRMQVCSHCVERLPGGPPCAAMGRVCGVELHLPRLIDAIHRVQNGSMEPYSDSIRCLVCQGCAALGSIDCPCPMDYFLPLVVQAVETVDQRNEPPT